MSRKYPPISIDKITQLRADAANLPGTAARKGTTLDRWDEHQESAAAKNHFDLGCWLYYYQSRMRSCADPVQGLKDRIDCAKRIFEAGLNNPGYQFFTAFDFGERDFDGIFEQGDSLHVIHGLRKHIDKDATGNIKGAFEYMGWPVNGISKVTVSLISGDGHKSHFDVSFGSDGIFAHSKTRGSTKAEMPTESVHFMVWDYEGNVLCSEFYVGDIWRDLEGAYDQNLFWKKVFRDGDLDKAVGQMERDLFEQGLVTNPIYPDGFEQPDADSDEDEKISEAPSAGI